MAACPEPQPCAHCGEPAPAGSRFCCAGCEAISAAIAGLAFAPRERPLEDDAGYAAYDDARVQAAFVRAAGEALEAELIVEHLRCAACAWLVEKAAARMPGVTSVHVNFALRRMRLRWDPSRGRLGAILEAIARLGYAAWPYEEGRLALVGARERRSLLRRLWIAGLGMMQVMMYAVPAYVGAEEVGAQFEGLMRWAGLLLTLPVLLYSAAPFFRGAWRDLRVGRLGMDVPIALGIAAAFEASAWSTVAGHGTVYFDSVAMFVFLILGGRYLELMARERAARGLQYLGRLVPQSALRLAPGDLVMVRPGEIVPADGVVESEAATVSEAWLTGESRPLARAHGAAVLGGSVNAGNAFMLAVRRVGAETALSGIHRLIQRALEERPRWVEAAQRASHAFVVFVLVAAAAALAAWWSADPARAVSIAVSVLIVTCPCALALAAPAVSTVAIGAMARHNLAVTRGHAVEALAAATDFVFDKTGTLTGGELELLEVLPLRGDAAGGLALAAALAERSAHPVDAALRRAHAGALPLLRDHASHSGQGVEAHVVGTRMRLGRASFAQALHGKPVPVAWMSRTDTIAWLADERGWIAAFRFGDRVRPEAAAALAALRAGGAALHVLSGDEAPIVQRLAAELGIAHVRAHATPADKCDYVKGLQAAGRRVAMVGDGINDAPVLAQADVAIAMGGGADLAQVRGDIVLLSSSPADLARGVAVARKARRVLRENLAWALAYNLIAVPLAFAGLVTPLAAGIGMSASSLLVVVNALRVRR